MNNFRGLLFDLGDTLLGNQLYDPNAGNARLLECADNSPKISPEDIQAHVRVIESSVISLRNESLFEFSSQSFQRILYEQLGLSFSLSPAEMELEFWRTSVSILLSQVYMRPWIISNRAGLKWAS